MNREDKLKELVANVENWPKFVDIDFHTACGWDMRDNKFVHTIHDPITVDDWNRAKIVPNTKIRVESPEHSEYVQKLAFEEGFEWQDTGRELYDLSVNNNVFFCPQNKIVFNSMKRKNYKEIFIEMPKAPEADINARVLAEKVGAADVLTAGAKHLSDRAATYDSPEGERSMCATVEAFESITGHSLTEEQGWLFMVMLKAVRSQQGNYKLDNYEDGAAYFALMAESASEARK